MGSPLRLGCLAGGPPPAVWYNKHSSGYFVEHLGLDFAHSRGVFMGCEYTTPFVTHSRRHNLLRSYRKRPSQPREVLHRTWPLSILWCCLYSKSDGNTKPCNLAVTEEENGAPGQLMDQGPILNPVCCALDAEADAAQGYFQIQTNSSS